MKIVICTIMKDEPIEFVSRWFDSSREADEHWILDTGSTNGCAEHAQMLGINVLRAVINPWRFDVARNTLLDSLPSDADYVINLDIDEVLVPGWRQIIDKISTDITRPRYKYVWSWNADGSEGLVYSGDKIASRHGYRWKNPVHEVMLPKEDFVEIQYFMEGFEIQHYPDNSKSRGQYLPLLEMAVKEDPANDRNVHYLAREYFFNAEPEKASDLFLRHLILSKWAPERAWSMRYLSKIHLDQTEHWLLRACAEYPVAREPWYDLALHYHMQKNWHGALYAATRVLSITEKPLLYLNEATAWGSGPYDIAAIACHNLGLKNEALAYGLNALNLEPNNQRLLENILHYNKEAYDKIKTGEKS